MICLRSGYCCIGYDVIIVDNPSKGVTEGNLIHKPSEEPCKHLSFDGVKSECSIHSEEWYKETPCFNHTQIESHNSSCRIGEYKLKGKL